MFLCDALIRVFQTVPMSAERAVMGARSVPMTL